MPNLKINEDTYQRLRLLADQHGQSMAGMVAMLLATAERVERWNSYAAVLAQAPPAVQQARAANAAAVLAEATERHLRAPSW